MGLGPRFARAFLNVPAMADLLAYRHGRATSGYNRLLWRNPAAAMPAVETACGYYDTAHFAPLVRTSLRVVVGLSDDVCPFITGIAAFNCTASDDRRLYAVPGMRHVYGTPHNDEINAWLNSMETAPSERP